ncbi:uncharacterized protein [Nicotiana sylvestris]|uniref:uncharacterized protein n=1 Tax=Nicotiana sylvestris TaxID=4096 RepID=UPI00388CB2D3
MDLLTLLLSSLKWKKKRTKRQSLNSKAKKKGTHTHKDKREAFDSLLKEFREVDDILARNSADFESFPKAGGILNKNEIPLTTISEIDIFDVWGFDFMGPFVSSCGNTYILVMVDYVSKWVEVVALPNYEARSVVAFLKLNIFTIFGTPRAVISDGGLHFCNKAFDTLLSKTGYKKLIEISPYRLVLGKACHLSVELEHKAMWALRKLNLEWDVAANLKVAQLNELDEFRYHAYTSSSLYKEKMKYLHDKNECALLGICLEKLAKYGKSVDRTIVGAIAERDLWLHNS